MKYKLWNKCKKKFEEKGWVVNPEGEVLWIEYGEIVCGSNMKNYALLENTKIKDITGKEIFEGDIVETTRALNHIVGVVTMIKGCWYIQDGKDSYYRLKPRYGTCVNKVIGNVYENKELLEVE